MNQFQTIVEGPWKELDLHAESIPSLLHWDFAYLWVLEKGITSPHPVWPKLAAAW